MTRLQKTYYRAIHERNYDNLVKGGKSSNLPRHDSVLVMALLINLAS